eukprot:3130002-Pyramimonas_sp.AAC.1
MIPVNTANSFNLCSLHCPPSNGRRMPCEASGYANNSTLCDTLEVIARMAHFSHALVCHATGLQHSFIRPTISGLQ